MEIVASAIGHLMTGGEMVRNRSTRAADAVLAAALTLLLVGLLAWRRSAIGFLSIAAVLAIYALGVGAWLYHSIERLIVARRIATVRSATRPLQPLLPVMAAIMGLTQAVVRSLGDVTDLPARRWELPVLRWVDNTRANRRVIDSDDELDR